MNSITFEEFKKSLLVEATSEEEYDAEIHRGSKRLAALEHQAKITKDHLSQIRTMNDGKMFVRLHGYYSSVSGPIAEKLKKLGEDITTMSYSEKSPFFVKHGENGQIWADTPEALQVKQFLDHAKERDEQLVKLIKKWKTQVARWKTLKSSSYIKSQQSSISDEQIAEDQVPKKIPVDENKKWNNPYHHRQAMDITKYAGHPAHFKWPSSQTKHEYVKLEKYFSSKGITFDKIYVAKIKTWDDDEFWNWIMVSSDGKVLWRKFQEEPRKSSNYLNVNGTNLNTKRFLEAADDVRDINVKNAGLFKDEKK